MDELKLLTERLEASELLVRTIFFSLKHASPEYAQALHQIVEGMAQDILDQKPQPGWPISAAGARLARSTAAKLIALEQAPMRRLEGRLARATMQSSWTVSLRGWITFPIPA